MKKSVSKLKLTKETLRVVISGATPSVGSSCPSENCSALCISPSCCVDTQYCTTMQNDTRLITQ